MSDDLRRPSTASIPNDASGRPLPRRTPMATVIANRQRRGRRRRRHARYLADTDGDGFDPLDGNGRLPPRLRTANAPRHRSLSSSNGQHTPTSTTDADGTVRRLRDPARPSTPSNASDVGGLRCGRRRGINANRDERRRRNPCPAHGRHGRRRFRSARSGWTSSALDPDADEWLDTDFGEFTVGNRSAQTRTTTPKSGSGLSTPGSSSSASIPSTPAMRAWAMRTGTFAAITDPADLGAGVVTERHSTSTTVADTRRGSASPTYWTCRMLSPSIRPGVKLGMHETLDGVGKKTRYDDDDGDELSLSDSVGRRSSASTPSTPANAGTYDLDGDGPTYPFDGVPAGSQPRHDLRRGGARDLHRRSPRRRRSPTTRVTSGCEYGSRHDRRRGRQRRSGPTTASSTQSASTITHST